VGSWEVEATCDCALSCRVYNSSSGKSKTITCQWNAWADLSKVVSAYRTKVVGAACPGIGPWLPSLSRLFSDRRFCDLSCYEIHLFLSRELHRPLFAHYLDVIASGRQRTSHGKTRAPSRTLMVNRSHATRLTSLDFNESLDRTFTPQYHYLIDCDTVLESHGLAISKSGLEGSIWKEQHSSTTRRLKRFSLVS
jgi:hypothetical protein